MNDTKEIKADFSVLYDIISEKLSKGFPVSFTANGISMLPVIRNGKDKVTLSRIVSPPKKGDIVFYRRKNGDFVLHRIIKCGDDEYTMCGDNQCSLEKGIKKEQLIGIMTSVERGGNKKSTPYPSRLWILCLPFRRIFLRVFRKAARTIEKIRK